MNYEDIVSFVLPKVKDNKQEEAMQVIKQTFKPESPGFLQSIINMICQKKDSPDAASMLSVLLTMVKPEHIAEIQAFFASLFQKRDK